ncbi:MAG: EGF domain-containing protein [Myxococcota bacterium]
MSLIDRSARASRRVVTLSVGALVGASIAQAACMGAPEPAGPRLSIAVAPLDLPGIAEACYDLRATAGPGGSGELVWSEPDLCSTRYGDGRGALSYVGTCVAGVTHTVLLTMVSLSDADGPVGFVNPCPADAPCALESPCVANADTPVTFNLTVMRGAEQGFFDVAVSFADLFCSAKVDCLGGPEVGLFPPGGAARVPAVVMAFACTGGAGADVGTQLYLGDVRLDCDGASLSLPVSGPPGNAYSLASPPPSPILQLATYRGHGDLAAAGETPWNALYYNVALALDPTRVATSCELTATATAADHAWLPPFVTPAHTAYPLMRVDLPLVVGPGASGYACARHPLGDGPEDGIWTEYTGLDAALVMDRRAFVADGQVQVEERRRCAVGHGGCDVHATCTDLPPAVACACDDGWDGDGLACDDLDECQPTSPCAAYEDCANTPGSFECRAITAAADAGPSFAPTFVGLSTIPGRVLVHATGLGRLTVGSVSASGDFSVAQNGCTSPVEPGASCPIDVVFAPSAGGPRAGTLSIDSDAGPTPLSVALAGVGVVPEALEIGPADAALAPGYALTFAAVGGVEPYSFSVASGGGTFAGAVYTAPLEVGTAVVRVTDHVGATRETSVTIGLALAIGPSSLALAVGNSATFSASGGVGPYSFSLVAPSDGSLVGAGATATYTAPAAPGGATVRVTDSFGMSADALVTVGPALAIDPPAVTLPVRGTRQFTTSGGVAPVTLSIAAGGGSLQAGLFTAPSTAQTVVVRATDARGNLADATVTVVPPLALSPTDVLLAVGNSQTFVASGGAGGYSFSVIGDGSVDAVGVYTAAAAPGGATVRVSDAIGGHADASVTVVPALLIDPPSVTIAVGKTAVFTSTGGVGGARFDVASGSGSFVGGTYTAPQTPGSATVRVTDNRGNTSLATVTIASLPVIDRRLSSSWSGRRRPSA